MSDPRTTPDPARITERSAKRVTDTFVDICREPDGPRDRQANFGATLTQLSETDGWAYIQTNLDGYVGYVAATALDEVRQATHRVKNAASTLYQEPDFKALDLMALSHGSLLTVTGTVGNFLEATDGFVPRQHLVPIDVLDTDPALVAALYLGTAYLWGGNSRWGIDCSGLIQAALTACGIPCLGDSDQQMAIGAAANGSYKRNDLLFWKGHVALVTKPDTIIHANAHAMAVTYESTQDAIARIAATGGGHVTAHRRL